MQRLGLSILRRRKDSASLPRELDARTAGSSLNPQSLQRVTILGRITPMLRATSNQRAARQYLGWEEFILRWVARALARGIYRFRASCIHNLPDKGPALLIANHLSYIDWLFIATASPRPVHFVMHHKYTGNWFLDWVCRVCEVIPIAPAREDAGLLDRSFQRIANALEKGELVCIFPEGELTPDGEMGRFRPGIRNILNRTPVPVVPMALENMWDSVFSLNQARSSLFTRMLGPQVTLRIGVPIQSELATQYSLKEFEQEVRNLRA